MKVYIPFNSNDFNSVFTTLSLSPCSFYPNRGYSFKRASATLLNESEDFLVGFQKPIFHTKEYDKDHGLPILLEIDVAKSEVDFNLANGVKYIIIDTTVYLFNGFKLIFRSQKELKETLAKSLKSIETKYADLAKANSKVLKEDCFINELPRLKFPASNNENNETTFYKERKLNKLLGTTLGSSIAFSHNLPKEWQDITLLLRALNNNLSLYLNKIGENNDHERTQSLEIVTKISQTYEGIEKLDETLIFESSMNSDTLNSIKETKIFNIPAYDLIIEGLLVNQKIDLPMPLKLVKLKRIINSKFNVKYPNNYIEKVSKAFNEIKTNVESQISLSKKVNNLSYSDLLIPELKNGEIIVNGPDGLNQAESEYLKHAVTFFTQADQIQGIEFLFTYRKEILIGLANHFKLNVQNFSSSKEREYLFALLKSFDSLRGGFQVAGINNEVLKSLAILFTSGRDLIRFIESNEREGISNSIIPYSIWGAVYGAAILPKTLTEVITNDSKNLQPILNAFGSILNGFKQANKDSGNQFTSSLKDDDHQETEKIEEVKQAPSHAASPTAAHATAIEVSALAKVILQSVSSKKKIKLAEIKKLSKAFRSQDDIKEIIREELDGEVTLAKEGQTFYAKMKPENELFA